MLIEEPSVYIFGESVIAKVFEMPPPHVVDVVCRESISIEGLRVYFGIEEEQIVRVTTGHRAFDCNADYWIISANRTASTLDDEYPLSRSLIVSSGALAAFDVVRILIFASKYPWQTLPVAREMVSNAIEDEMTLDEAATLAGFDSLRELLSGLDA